MGNDFFSGSNIESILAPGEHFHGYEVKKFLGCGGSAAVYLVRHEMLDSLLALKVMVAPETSVGYEPVKRFLREAKLASRIQHPNLVRVHDAGFDAEKNIYYLVMDYLTGGTLRDRLAFGGPVPPDEAIEIVRQIASALQAGEKLGVVHRDIKPENIMFASDGRAKLVDLGIAKACTEDSIHTTTGQTFGTPAYIAPEQALDASAVDTRADIYSLGIVLFEMLSGRKPFAGDTIQAVIAQVVSDSPIMDIRRVSRGTPKWIAALLAKMCEKDREKRIASSSMLLAEIKAHLKTSGGDEDCAEYTPEAPRAQRTLAKTVNTPEEDALVDAVIAEKQRKRRIKELVHNIILWGSLVVVLISSAVIVFTAFSRHA